MTVVIHKRAMLLIYSRVNGDTGCDRYDCVIVCQVWLGLGQDLHCHASTSTCILPVVCKLLQYALVYALKWSSPLTHSLAL